MIKSRAAVAFAANQPLQIVEVDVAHQVDVAHATAAEATADLVLAFEAGEWGDHRGDSRRRGEGITSEH